MWEEEAVAYFEAKLPRNPKKKAENLRTVYPIREVTHDILNSKQNACL